MIGCYLVFTFLIIFLHFVNWPCFALSLIIFIFLGFRFVIFLCMARNLFMVHVRERKEWEICNFLSLQKVVELGFLVDLTFAL